MINSLRFHMLVCLLAYGCLPPTKEELNMVAQLNQKYPEYAFSTFPGIKDVYLRLSIKSNEVDSLELEEVHQYLAVINKDSLGNDRTNLLYIIVYDRDEKYLFTIKKNREGIVFFKDAIY